MGQKLGLSKLSARLLIRNMEKLNLITFYLLDEGRQRTRKYITCRHKESAVQSFTQELLTSTFMTDANDSTSKILEGSNIQFMVDDVGVANETNVSTEQPKKSQENQLTDKESPVPKENRLSKLKDDINVNDVTVEITKIDRPPYLANLKLLNESSITLRMAKRLIMIQKHLAKSVVCDDVFKIVTALTLEETRMGYKDKMCKKSIYRLLAKLSSDQRLNLYSIKLEFKDAVKTLLFVTEPTVTPEHILLLNLIDKEKFRFLLRISNVQAKKEQSEAISELQHRSGISMKLKKAKRIKGMHDQNFNYGSTPKFARIRTLHELLFYILYDQPKDVKPVTIDSVMDQWKNEEPTIDFDELRPELSPMYSPEINWKMFVPPLVHFYDNQSGWTVLTDLLHRMPLSLFVKMCNITMEIPGLDAYLKHPIRRHFLMNYIPMHLKDLLMFGRKYIFHIDEGIRHLCAIGLVRLGPQRMKEKEHVTLYLNRRASLWRTVDSEPGYFKITKKDYEVISYTFDNELDLHTYWHDMYSISVSTRLGRRNESENDVIIKFEHKEEIARALAPIAFADAEQLDDGTVPGDNLGAAGLDSSLFAHMPRNWLMKKAQLKKPPAHIEKVRSFPKLPISKTIRRSHLTAGKNP